MNSTPNDSKVPVLVRQHPEGGYTHAVLTTGTTRIYKGWWPTEAAARAQIPCGVPAREKTAA